jgi:hypothetical protein
MSPIYFGSLGIAVIVAPAVALLGGGTTCQANRVVVKTQAILSAKTSIYHFRFNHYPTQRRKKAR